MGIKRKFLIDSENVSDYSFIKEYNVNKDDNIIVFISENSKSIKIQSMQALIECEAQVTFEKVETGVLNALDFQLVAYLGMEAQTGVNYYVVSDDCGFEVAINYIMQKLGDGVIIEMINPSKVCSVNQAKEELCVDVESISKPVTKQSILDRISKSFEVVNNASIRKSLKNTVQSALNQNKGHEEIRVAMMSKLNKRNISSIQKEKICNTILDSVDELLNERKKGRMGASVKLK